MQIERQIAKNILSDLIAFSFTINGPLHLTQKVISEHLFLSHCASA